MIAALALAAALQQKLTIEDAVRLAKEHNPAFAKVQNDVSVSEADVRQRWGAFLPSVSADMRFSGSNSSIVTGQDDFGQPIELPQAREFKGSSAQQGIGLQMTVFDGGAALRELRAARAGVDASNARVFSESLRLTGEVKRQYYNALRAAKLIEVEKALLVSAQERLQRTEQLLRVAGSGPVDVLGARAEVAGQEQQLSTREADARKQLLVLQEMMGVSGDVAYELASDLPASLDPSNIPVADLVARALSSSPDVIEARAVARAADQQLSAARATRMPAISANAGYGRTMSLNSYDALFELNPQNRGFNFGLSASLPIFNGFRTSATITRADASLSDARHDERMAALRAERQVRSAYIDVANAHKQLELAERKAAISRERLDLAQEQYRNGGMSFAELQIIIDRTATAERDVVEARVQYASNITILEQYVGSPLTASR